MSGNKKKRGGFKRALLWFVCILLALLLAGLLFVVGFVQSKLGLVNRPQESVPTLSLEEIAEIENETEPEDVGNTAPEMDPEEVTWATEPVQVIGGEEETRIINILLIGQDRREGQGRQRSDSMILCTVNTEKKTLTMTSFQRDTYLQIPGYQDNRINASYAFGGMPLLNETLYVNYGIKVDGNVEVDFGEFTQIIDMMGGVDIYLSEREAEYINNHTEWTMEEGVNHFDGEKALFYARIRKLDNDFRRASRQRNVLTALFNKCKNMSVSSLNNLLNKLLPLVTTDISNQEIIGYFVELVPLLPELTITTQSIPAAGTYHSASVRGMYVLIPDLEANRQILIETLLGE